MRAGIQIKIPEGLRPSACIEITDHNYDDELIVSIHNDGMNKDHCRDIMDGDRFAQLLVIPYIPIEICEES